MAVATVLAVPQRSAVIAAAREQLLVLETAARWPCSASAAAFTDDLTIQRIDVEDIAVVGSQTVALMVQRGRRSDGTWAERRLSAVFGDAGAPVLHGSWVGGLDAASRA